MKDKQKPAAALESAKAWQPVKDLVDSLRLANVAAKVTFDEKGATVQLTIPWAEVPPELSKGE